MGLLTVVALAPAPLALACGDDSNDSEEERVKQIAGIAELATNAYASVGAEGLYDYVEPQVAEKCTKRELVEALDREPVPDGFAGLNGVEFAGKEARAAVIQRFGDDEREVQWLFVSIDDRTWRLRSLPGLEGCLD